MSGGRGRRGFVMVALLAAIAILLIGMGAGAPTWAYVMKDSREQELIFRGAQIADAIGRYQRKNGNALPTSIEQLVQGRFLRRAYEDPMTPDGEWRLLRQGEAIPATAVAGRGASTPGSTGVGARAGEREAPPVVPAAAPLGALGSNARSVGAIAGVASRSTDLSLRLFNGRNRYSEWIFAPGLPRVVGRQQTPAAPRPGGERRPPNPR